jgi:hypothetical protein
LAGLGPATHALGRSKQKDVDARIKSAQDDFKSFLAGQRHAFAGMTKAKGD